MLPYKSVPAGELTKDATAFEYNLNMRNYMKSSDVMVKTVKELRQTTETGSTLEVIFDCKDKNVPYKTAGNLAIYAENSKDDVHRFAKRVGLDLASKFMLEANSDFSGRKS